MNRRATTATNNKKKNKTEKKSKMKRKRTQAVRVHTQTEALILPQQRPHTVPLPCSPCGGGVSQDVSSNRLLGIGGEHGGTVHLRHHLVGDHHGHAKLIHGAESREVTTLSTASVHSSSSSAASPFLFVHTWCLSGFKMMHFDFFYFRIKMKSLKKKKCDVFFLT